MYEGLIEEMEKKSFAFAFTFRFLYWGSGREKRAE